MVLYAAVYVHFAAQLASYPYDVDQGEGYDTWSAWLLTTGQLPYSDNEQFPFYSSNYPPLWSAIVALPLLWTGPSLSPGRVVSALATLGCAVLIALAAYRRTTPIGDGTTGALAGALGAGLFLASPYVFHTTPLARVNGTTLLFALLALSFFEQTSGRRLILGIVALLAALFTKQTAFDAALACLVFVALVQPQTAKQATLLLGGIGAALLTSLVIATDGAFWLNVVIGNANPFDPAQLLGYIRNFLEVHPFLLTLAIVECGLAIRRRAWSPWVLYLPSAGAMSLTVGKWGAGESYFLPLVAVSCVLGSSLLARLATHRPTQEALLQSWRSSRRPSLALLTRITAGLLVVQLLLFSHGPLTSIPGLPDRGFQAPLLGQPSSRSDFEAAARLTAILQASLGPSLVEDAGFLLVAGKPIVGNPTHLRNLHDSGQWDADGLVAAIRAHEFGVIVLNAQLYPAPVLSAIGRSYYVDQSFHIRGAEYLVFLPGGD